MSEYFWIAIFIIILINAAVWIFFMPWYVNRRLDRFQSELVNRHCDEVETMYRRMRGWRHDYHNHIQVLKAHMELGEYGAAEGYLDRLAEDLSGVDTILKTGNVMLDAILNSKLTLMKDRGIHTDVTAYVPPEVGISGVDLSVLIGNLLDNAMEACLRMEREEDRFVRVYIDMLKSQLYLSVTNSMEGRPRRSGAGYVSSKAEDGGRGRFSGAGTRFGGFSGGGLHGFGILRIDAIVSKYHGYINRQCEQGVFATEVTLPIVR